MNQMFPHNCCYILLAVAW